MRRTLHLLLLLSAVGCASRGGTLPRPDTDVARWRPLLGCYRLGDVTFALDSVPEPKLVAAQEPGIHRARFDPPAIVGGYWFVTREGTVWISRHDGLWGKSWELRAHGDTLSGREHLRTDVLDARHQAVSATAIRTRECPPPAAD